MLQRTSPPTFCTLASLSVITPFDVEMIATPKPFLTLLNSSGLAYVRKPGRLILSKLCIAGNLVVGSYLSAILI